MRISRGRCTQLVFLTSLTPLVLTCASSPAYSESPRIIIDAHRKDIVSLLFSVKGDTLVSSSSDSTVKYWDVGSGRLIKAFDAGGDSFTLVDVAWNSDTISLAQGETIRFVRGSTLSNLGSVRAAGVVLQGQFIRDNRCFLYLYFDPRGIVLGTVNTQRMQSCPGPYLSDGVPTAAAIADDGSKVAVATFQRRSRHGTPLDVVLLRIIDVKTGAPTSLLEESVEEGRAAPKGIVSVCFSPDGNKLALGFWDASISIVDAGNGNVAAVLKGHQDWVTSLTYLERGSLLASGSRDGSVRLWETRKFACVGIMRAGSKEITRLSASDASRVLAAGDYSGKIALWDLPLSPRAR